MPIKRRPTPAQLRALARGRAKLKRMRKAAISATKAPSYPPLYRNPVMAWCEKNGAASGLNWIYKWCRRNGLQLLRSGEIAASNSYNKLADSISKVTGQANFKGL